MVLAHSNKKKRESKVTTIGAEHYKTELMQDVRREKIGRNIKCI